MQISKDDDPGRHRPIPECLMFRKPWRDVLSMKFIPYLADLKLLVIINE